MHNTNAVFIPPCQLASVRMTGAYCNASVAAWQRLLDWISLRGHDVVDRVGYGLTIDDPRTTPGELLRYEAAIKVPTTWEGRDSQFADLRKFAGGAYFKMRHIGPYSELGSVISKARDTLVPREGLIHDMSRPLLTMYYSYPSLTPAPMQVADVCVPIFPDRRIQPRVLH